MPSAAGPAGYGCRADLMTGQGMTTGTKSEPAPSDHEVLTGLAERVTYQNAENGFCVVRIRARGHRELVTLVGHAAAISAGEWITASGGWINDRTHGQQFKARFLKTSAPTSVEGIEKYLASGMIRGDVDERLLLFCIASVSQAGPIGPGRG